MQKGIGSVPRVCTKSEMREDEGESGFITKGEKRDGRSWRGGRGRGRNSARGGGRQLQLPEAPPNVREVGEQSTTGRRGGGRGRRGRGAMGRPIPPAEVHGHAASSGRAEGGGSDRWATKARSGRKAKVVAVPPPQVPVVIAKGRKVKADVNSSAARQSKGSGKGEVREAGKKKKNKRRDEKVFEPHLSEEAAMQGLAAGLLFEGILRIHSHQTAFVSTHGGTLPCDIFVDGSKERNRALDGDTVVVQLHPEEDWSKKFQSQEELGAATDVAPASLEEVGLTSLSLRDAVDGDEQAEREGAERRQKHSHELWGGDFTAALGSHADAGAGAGASGCALCPLGVLAKAKGLQPKGKIVFISKPGGQSSAKHIGGLVPIRALQENGRLDDKDNFMMFMPADARVPRMLIPRGECPGNVLENPSSFASTMFMARMRSGSSEGWSPGSRYPLGEGLHSVGQAGVIVPETAALLAQFGVDHGDFPPQVMDSLEQYLAQDAEAGSRGLRSHNRNSNWQIPESEVQKRRDLRSTRIFTIDPPTAKDLDDALHVTKLDDGNIEIGVHIADVSFFVQPGTALDAEALRRATTVYLVQKVALRLCFFVTPTLMSPFHFSFFIFPPQAIPMLPPLLCNNLASLHPCVDRLAFSVVWKMTPDGDMVEEEPWFGRTIIRSCCKLDYGTAQHMIEGSIPSDGREPTPDMWEPTRRPVGHSCQSVTSDVLLMHAVAKKRRAKRFAAGALSLNSTKLSFKLDREGNPEAFCTYPIRDSNKLVEEYMLMANFQVAKQLALKAGGAALLRRHPPPLAPKMAQIKNELERKGIHLDVSSAAALQASLNQLGQQRIIKEAVVQMLTLPMNPALYMAAGEMPSALWAHYALAINAYTHFTSPIRRYADLVVHRLLQATLDESARQSCTSPGAVEVEIEDQLSEEDVVEISARCNEMRMNAKKAQERSDTLFLAVYLVKHPQACDAIVIGVSQKVVTVYVSELGIDARLYIDKLGGAATWDADASEIALAARGRGQVQRLSLLSRVRVMCTAKRSVPIEVEVTLL
ncbi:unnamed protein product [Chrysoparadoxa australica]